MAAPINYDFRQVAVLVGGVPIEGFADGDSVSIEPNTDSFTLQIGIDGEGARSRQNDKSATITLTLMAGAAANLVLQGLQTLDDVSGVGTFPFAVTDLRGSYLCATIAAWIKKPPSRSFGRDNGTVEWVLETNELLLGHAASARASLI
jgi:hypothetical protein